MQGDVVLPAFELDCRDWLVITPEEADLPDELAGAPLLAVLSSAVLDGGDFRSVSAVVTVGLLDDATDSVARLDEATEPRPADGHPVAGPAAWIDDDTELGLLGGVGDTEVRRYLVPSPDRQLGLVVEFRAEQMDTEVLRRIDNLIGSFRWAA